MHTLIGGWAAACVDTALMDKLVAEVCTPQPWSVGAAVQVLCIGFTYQRHERVDKFILRAPVRAQRGSHRHPTPVLV